MLEKNIKIEIIKAGEPTINGRVYPKEELEKALARIDPDDNALVGRLGEGAGADPTKIDVGTIAFLVKDVRMEGDSVVGDMNILDTPCGRTLGVSLSSFRFMPAGIGVVDNKGNVSDYKFLCVDGIVDGKE